MVLIFFHLLPTTPTDSGNLQVIEGHTSESESWRPFASFEKASCLAALDQITIDHDVAPPLPAFPA